MPMLGTPLSAWLLTCLFALTATFYAAQAAFGDGHGRPVATSRMSSVWHVLMSLAMIAMLWSWGTAIPPLLLAVVFGVATAWFGAHALFSRPGVDHWPDAHVGGYRYHAAMMTAMVVMAGIMAAARTSPVPLAAGMGMADMSSAAMGSGTGAPAPTVTYPMTMSTSGWLSVLCLALAACFFAAAGWLLVRCGQRVVAPRSGQTRQRVLTVGAVNVAMAAGMGAVFLQMS